MRISRIRLSDHLRPAACAAGLPDGSLCPPFGKADIVHEESDIPIVSWQSPSGTDAYAEAITATRSEQPSPLYGMSSYYSPPGNRCTTHSGQGFSFWITTSTCPFDGNDRATSRTRWRILRQDFSRGHIHNIRPGALRNSKPRTAKAPPN